MTADDLLCAGFRRFNPPMTSRAADLFQIRIADESGVRYFINVERWEAEAEVIPEAWEADIHFNDGASWHPTACLVVKAYSVREWSAEDLLRWGRELWDRIAPNYYESWE